MPRRRIGFGIIGAGLMGREFAIACARWPALLDLDIVPELAAVCDVNPAVLPWYTDNFSSIRLATTNHYQLLERTDVEAVYCAVPHNLHAELYVDVIEAGKHLLGEKPFGMDLPAYERIMRAVRAHPEVLVRVSSEFPFYPGAQRIVQAVQEGRLGKLIDVRAGFLHSSDLDPNKPINWKRVAAINGAYGCMGDLGMHVVHLPARFGWIPRNVRAILSKIVTERPDKDGKMVPCDTWDNALLITEVEGEDGTFPMTLETKRISPGDTNTWYLEVLGTRGAVGFSTKHPRTLRVLEYQPGGEQAWRTLDLGYESVYRTITGSIFEFGLPDAILQMWAAFVDELAHGEAMIGNFKCATPEEAGMSHRLFTAALESSEAASVVPLSTEVGEL